MSVVDNLPTHMWYTMRSMGRLGIAVRCVLTGFFVLAVACTVAPTAFAADAGSAAELENPLGDATDVNLIIGRVIRSGFGIVGSIGLLMFIYGGFVWLTSGGSSDKVQKGRDAMVWAIFGIAVIFAAYAITSFVLTSLTK